MFIQVASLFKLQVGQNAAVSDCKEQQDSVVKQPKLCPSGADAENFGLGVCSFELGLNVT